MCIGVVEIIVEIILVDTRVPGVPVVEIIVEILLVGTRVSSDNGNRQQAIPGAKDTSIEAK